MISYIFYIVPIISLICLLGFLLIKYYSHICFFFNINKNSENKTNISNRIKNLKNKYDIKSTEKTNINSDIKFIVKNPTYLKINKMTNINKDINKDIDIDINKDIDIKINNKNDFKNLLNDDYNKKIITSYIYNKNLFVELFQNKDGTVKIKNLESFNIFHKKNLHNRINSNILLKFHNEHEYLYIFVNDNNLVKITNNNEYDQIVNLIENNNNIFLIQETKSKSNSINFITYGGYSECEVNNKKIQQIFFNNSNKLNKNFKILKNFTNVKIFFYVSTQIE